MRIPDNRRSTEWVTRMPTVISALNKEVTRLTGKKPAEAIKKNCFSESLDPLFETRCCERKKAPLWFKCSLSLPTR